MTLKKYLSEKHKKHIIFDLDETLATLHIDWSQFRAGLWKAVGKFDKKIVTEVPNKPKMGNVLYNKTIIKHGKRGRKLVLEFCEKYEQDYYKGITENKALLNFVKDNHKKYDLHIWTSNNRKTTDIVIEKLKASEYFQKIVVKEDVNLLKPYPDGFYLIFDKKTQQRKDYLMIGDSEHDKIAARSAGIDFLEVKMRPLESYKGEDITDT